MNRLLALHADGLFFAHFNVLTSPKKDETAICGWSCLVFGAPIHVGTLIS